MSEPLTTYKYALAAISALWLSAVAYAAPLRAQTAGLDRYFEELADPEFQGWARAESDIERAWSRSGSAAMDLLLKRGRSALDDGDVKAAIGHLTALTDHAPEFAEGWNARATAYFVAGLYGPSMADIAQVLRLEPRHWGALAGLGMILDEMGDRARALSAYQASFALNPHQQDVKDAIERLQAELEGTAL